MGINRAILSIVSFFWIACATPSAPPRVSHADIAGRIASAFPERTALVALTRAAFAEYAQDLSEGADRHSLNATENLAHVRRLIELVLDHSSELNALGVDSAALVAGIALSDFGKSSRFARSLIDGMIARDEWKEGDPDNGLRAFLMHETHGLNLLERRWREFGLTEAERGKVHGAIEFHAGPATEGVWWHTQWTRLFPATPYGKVTTIEGVVHALLDRVDQGSLFAYRQADGEITLEGGVKKILYERQARPPGESMSALVVSCFEQNPTWTLEQIDDLRRSVKAFPDLSRFMNSDFARSEIGKVKRTLDLYRGGLIQAKAGRILVGGVLVNTPDELFSRLRSAMIARQ